MARKRLVAALLVAGALFLPVARPRADAPAISFTRDPVAACRGAITLAEASQAIPDHLLTAIAEVESGRPDTKTGAMEPWPWTIDVGGEGHYFATEQQAIDAVRKLQKKGVRSIDVGCLQVNLQQHPNAFVSLQEAFQPWANAAYGARFLRHLYDTTHDWTRAAALYHSADPALGAAYRARVMKLWPTARRQQTARAIPLHPLIGHDGMIVPSRRLARGGSFNEAAR